jgi:CyaY protein
MAQNCVHNRALQPTRSHALDDADNLVRSHFIKMILASMTDSADPAKLTDASYHSLSLKLLSSVEAALDAWLQSDVIDIDSARTGGMLEMGFPDSSKIVINTQPPLHEIWLAARSGGHHFKYRAGAWRDTKDGREFFEALSACASEQAGVELRFVAPQ